MVPPKTTASILRYAIVALLLLATNAPADESILETRSSLSLSASRDNIDNTEISLDSAIESANYLLLNIGYSHNRNDNGKDTVRQAYLGLRTDPYAPASIGFLLSFNRQTNHIDNFQLVLDNNRLDASTTLQTDNWQLNLTPAISALEIQLPRGNQINVNLLGANASVSYFGFDTYMLGAGYTYYIMSEIPFRSRIEQASELVKQVIIYAVETSATSMEAKSFSLSLGKQTQWGYFDYTYLSSQSLSIINRPVSTTSHIFSGSFTLSPRWSVEASLTSQNNSVNDTFQNLAIGMTYYW